MSVEREDNGTIGPSDNRMRFTPETDALVTEIKHRHAGQGLDDFDHYLHMCGDLAVHARKLEVQRDEAQAEIAKLQSQIAKWIPVGEALPEDGVVVLAVNWLAGSRPAPKLAWFDAREARWFAAVPGRSESVVTHWLAVPEFAVSGSVPTLRRDARGLASAEVKLAEAVRLLGLLVDSRACEFNRHGDCEVHHFAEPCPHELARVFVKEHQNEEGSRKGAEAQSGSTGLRDEPDGFYVERSASGPVGNHLLWWRKGGCGYTTSLNDAEVFAPEDSELPKLLRSGKYRLWPKAYVDSLATRCADTQLLDFNKAVVRQSELGAFAPPREESSGDSP